MSHFAQVIDGIVQQVIVAEQSFIDTLPDKQNWIQTSYNTRGGIHYAPNSNTPNGDVALRANYAHLGGIYDAKNDVFYDVRPNDMNGIPCESWTISAPTWLWTPPIPYPNDGQYYKWNESSKNWILISSN